MKSGIAKELVEHPYFQGFSAEHIERLAKFAREQQLSPGNTIFQEGQDADHLYLIREGKVAIELPLPNRDPLTILTIERGGIVGWSCLFPPFKWHFQARVTQPTQAIAIESKSLMELCESDPSLGYRVMRRTSRLMLDRLEAANQQLMDSFSDTGLIGLRWSGYAASPDRQASI